MTQNVRPLRAGLYARVSSERQAGADRVSIETQVAESRAYAESRDYVVVGEYVDCEKYKSAGKTVEPAGWRTDRPAWLRLIADVRAGRIDVIVAWKEDRLYRGAKSAVVIDELIDETRVSIELVKENFDRKMLYFKAAIARLELENIKERTEMGREGRVKRGLMGTGVYPGGYRPVRDARGRTVNYEILDEWRPVFKEIACLFLARVSYIDMARRIGYLPGAKNRANPATLRYMMVNPWYRGRIEFGRHRLGQALCVRGVHEPAWDERTCQAIERELRRRREMPTAIRRRSALPAIFAGILFCGYCGRNLAANLSRNIGGRAYRYYNCMHNRDVRLGVRTQEHPPNSLSERKVLALVERLLSGITPDQIDAYLARVAEQTPANEYDRVALLESQLDQARAAEADLVCGLEQVRHLPGAAEAMARELAAVRRIIDEKRTEIAGLEAAPAGGGLEQVREAMLYLAGRASELREMKPDDLKIALAAAFPRLWIKDKNLCEPPESVPDND